MESPVVNQTSVDPEPQPRSGDHERIAHQKRAIHATQHLEHHGQANEVGR